ncbi:MAG: DUF6055 domain-containing protein [Myxococcota bacterium]
MFLTPLVVLASGPALADQCDGLKDALDAIDAPDSHLTAALAHLSHQARHQRQVDCANDALRARGLPAGIMPADWAMPALPPPPDGELTTRDFYAVPNSMESDHFVVRWGSGITDITAQAVLDAFELAWTVEVEEMGYPAPLYADTTKVNVYLGQTGGNVPAISGGVGGYYTLDDEGYPMLVLSDTAYTYLNGYGDAVIAHELFHGVQGGARSTYEYANNAPGAWFWEATATWVMDKVIPDDTSHAGFLFGYSFLPHLSINHFAYPQRGTIEESHQYGAFIFIQHLTEHTADPDLIRVAWTESDNAADPLTVIGDRLVADYGTTLFDAFSDFAARNVSWDYENGELYEQFHEYYASNLPDQDFRLADLVVGDSDGWIEAEGNLPEWMGTNYIELAPLHDEAPVINGLRIQFEGDGSGDAGNQAEWSVWLVSPDGTIVLPLEVTDGVVDTTVDVTEDVWMVINATASAQRRGETFGYRYNITWTVDEPDDNRQNDGSVGDGEGPRGVGCATIGGGAMAGWAAWSGLLALCRRRRFSRRLP